jgi:hypothetical protein
MVITSAAAEFPPHPFGEHVEHDPIVVIEPSELTEVKEQMLLQSC